MNKSAFKEAVNEEPFKPVIISLASGRSVVVRHPENLIVRDVPAGYTIVAVFEGPEAPYLFEPKAVVSVSLLPRRNGVK